MAGGLRQVAALPDPSARWSTGWVRPNGLRIDQVRVPLGVVGDHLREPAQRHQRRRRRCASSRATPPSSAARPARSPPTWRSPPCCARVSPRPACPTTPWCSSRTRRREAAVEFMRLRGVDRLPHPPRRPVADRVDPRQRHRPLRDRRRRQLPRLRRRRRRPRHGRRHRRQRARAAPVGVQRGRVAASCTRAVADAFLPRVAAALDGVELVGDERARAIVAGASARPPRTTSPRSSSTSR